MTAVNPAPLQSGNCEQEVDTTGNPTMTELPGQVVSEKTAMVVEFPEEARSSPGVFQKAFWPTLFGVAFTFSVLFFLYIVSQFFAKPWYDWETVSDYGVSAGRAAPMMLHWVAGSIILLIGPLQLLPYTRRKKIEVHRWMGRVYLASTLVISVAGCVYVVTEGTVGGVSMDISFFLYGALFLTCAAMTYLRVRQGRIAQHRCWALRTFIVGFGSLIYRILILPLFVASLLPNSVFDSWSDDELMLWLNIAGWMFYIPELICMEIYIWRTTEDRSKLY